ncbi:hypothetical protein P154DRAFT_572570 [Amniculicola lignicola CBS 123094]|uniref:Uncharacterized protein n=1 Tax=Amniculicola lignicola CBS 123094 TaxID=1392246 RepID=A0A6A5WTN1_9PLEO|nr:hypothetical protein P154DRAFT_572570 [Amniculicola lignicola CBS 123094]
MDGEEASLTLSFLKGGIEAPPTTSIPDSEVLPAQSPYTASKQAPSSKLEGPKKTPSFNAETETSRSAERTRTRRAIRAASPYPFTTDGRRKSRSRRKGGRDSDVDLRAENRGKGGGKLDANRGTEFEHHNTDIRTSEEQQNQDSDANSPSDEEEQNEAEQNEESGDEDVIATPTPSHADSITGNIQLQLPFLPLLRSSTHRPAQSQTHALFRAQTQSRAGQESNEANQGRNATTDGRQPSFIAGPNARYGDIEEFLGKCPSCGNTHVYYEVKMRRRVRVKSWVRRVWGRFVDGVLVDMWDRRGKGRRARRVG